jgi:hypothetical protein
VTGVVKLPQARVRIAPGPAKEVDAIGDALAGGWREHVSVVHILGDGLDQIAEAAELELRARLVSQMHRHAAAVARELELLLGAQDRPVEFVDRVDARLGTADRAQKPGEPRVRELLHPDLQQASTVNERSRTQA